MSTDETSVPPRLVSDIDIVERLRWQKRYVYGLVCVTMEDAAKEIERLRSELRSKTNASRT